MLKRCGVWHDMWLCHVNIHTLCECRLQQTMRLGPNVRKVCEEMCERLTAIRPSELCRSPTKAKAAESGWATWWSVWIINVGNSPNIGSHFICQIWRNHIFRTTFLAYVEDEMWFHILTTFGWNKTVLKVRKCSHKWHYHTQKSAFVIHLKFNRQNIYPEVLDQIWSVYICEKNIAVSLNQSTCTIII